MRRLGARLAAAAATLALGASLSVVLVACGGEDDDREDLRRIEATFDRLRRDFAAGDVRGVCRGISEHAKRQVGSLGHQAPTTCRRDVRRFLGWIRTPAGAARAARTSGRVVGGPSFVRAEVDGDDATAIVALAQHARGRVDFVEEDGEWKLDSFFSVTGPPPSDLR